MVSRATRRGEEVASTRRPPRAYDLLTAGIYEVVKRCFGIEADAIPTELAPFGLKTPVHRLGNAAISARVDFTQDSITGGITPVSYLATRYTVAPYEPSPLWTGCELWTEATVTCEKRKIRWSFGQFIETPTGCEIELGEAVPLDNVGTEDPGWIAFRNAAERGDRNDIRDMLDSLARTSIGLKAAPPWQDTMLD